LAGTPAARPPAPQPGMSEIGATGTPIFGGFLRELGEYNAEFQGGPFAAFQIYEQMRRSDGQVAATLAAIKLPIRSAGWTVAEPEGATQVEKDATAFARECLLEELDLDAAIRNALLMLDFGVAAHEDVWYVDGNQVRLRKMAPRLPLTFYRWICEPGTDELLAIGQLGYRGGSYVTAEIPVEKIALFTFESEGANFAGRSLLRPMYQSWYIKSGLYKVDAIACERNGMGVPWARMAKGASKEDRKEALDWLSKLTAHEKAAILLPPEWEWGLKGVEGNLRDPKESIQHHNLQISMAGLAMFMNLGQTTAGARSLGETMADFFAMSIQATANQIARVMNLTTVKRLVDYNFAGVVNYPRLVPQEILSVKFENIVAALKDLAASSVNVVQPDDELEAWLRKKMGAPEAGKARTRPQVVAPVAPGGPGQEKTPAAAQEQTPAARPPAPLDKALQEKVAGSAGAGVVVDGVQVARELRSQEKCLALSAIVGELDRGRDEIAAALRAARSRVQAEVVNKLVNKPVRELHTVSIAPDAKLVGQVEGILQGLFEFGQAQVGEERGRQLQSAATVRAALAAVKRDPLGVYADGVVGEWTNNLTARAVNVALDWMRRPAGLTKGEVIRKVEEELDGQKDGWVDGVASKGANEAFADGRTSGFEEHADEIDRYYYSALLDLNTCENCAAADGADGKTLDEIPDCPNPDCDGGDRCRCVQIAVFKDEVQG
jgi:phage gp29-like protein